MGAVENIKKLEKKFHM